MSKKEKEKEEVEKLNKQAIYDPLSYIRCTDTRVDIVKDTEQIRLFREDLKKDHLSQKRLQEIEYHYNCLIEDERNELTASFTGTSALLAYAALGTTIIAGVYQPFIQEDGGELGFKLIGLILLAALALVALIIIRSHRRTTDQIKKKIHKEMLFLEVIRSLLAECGEQDLRSVKIRIYGKTRK